MNISIYIYLYIYIKYKESVFTFHVLTARNTPNVSMRSFKIKEIDKNTYTYKYTHKTRETKAKSERMGTCLEGDLGAG